jgi:GntR family transcriptional regulator
VFWHIHSSSGIPMYLQLEGQLKQAIAAGAVQVGEALPSVRKLATELRINPNTVARAYQNLERDGIIRTIPGGGCYVADNDPGLLKSERLKRLQPLAMQVAVEGKQLRLTDQEILTMVKKALESLGGNR